MEAMTSSAASQHTTTASSTNENDDGNNKFETSWEPEIADKILRECDLSNNGQQQQQPYMVALVGVPGGGKSVSSVLLSKYLELKLGGEMKAEAKGTIIMPHDGYHIPMEDLRKMPNSDDAIYRRGAPDTFDPTSLKRDLDRIKNGSEATVSIPGFDHAKGDPEPDQHTFIRQQHKIVICEGLVVFVYGYLLHNSDGWEDIASYFDLTIFIDSDIDQCVERLKIRNLVIPGYTPEEIQIRCEVVDRKNAMTVNKSRDMAHHIVKSIAM